jgi:hypothetical protein
MPSLKYCRKRIERAEEYKLSLAKTEQGTRGSSALMHFRKSASLFADCQPQQPGGQRWRIDIVDEHSRGGALKSRRGSGFRRAEVIHRSSEQS